LSTTEQTIPEDEEREEYQAQTSDTDTGKAQVTDKKVIWGAMAVIVVLLMIISNIE
jgi:hypothetical protein